MPSPRHDCHAQNSGLTEMFLHCAIPIVNLMTRSRYYPDNLYKCYVINAPVRKLSLPETAVALSCPPLALLTRAHGTHASLSDVCARLLGVCQAGVESTHAGQGHHFQGRSNRAEQTSRP
eukprot:COSAG01_NODE_395_length_17610_cov_20.238764_8_plen_120_part_00